MKVSEIGKGLSAWSVPLTGSLRYWLTGRRALVAGVGVVGVGAALNWEWLVAAGLAPLILTVLPCAAMCALGIWCAKGDANASCSKTGPTDRVRDLEAEASPPQSPAAEGAARVKAGNARGEA